MIEIVIRDSKIDRDRSWIFFFDRLNTNLYYQTISYS